MGKNFANWVSDEWTSSCQKGGFFFSFILPWPYFCFNASIDFAEAGQLTMHLKLCWRCFHFPRENWKSYLHGLFQNPQQGVWCGIKKELKTAFWGLQSRGFFLSPFEFKSKSKGKEASHQTGLRPLRFDPVNMSGREECVRVGMEILRSDKNQWDL